MKFSHDRIFLLACVLCGLPVMLPFYPAMVDVPQHAAQITALKALLGGSPWAFTDMFELRLFTPYWLGYGLVMILSIPFDVVIAIKIIIASAQCLFVWAAARFCIKMKMPAEWRWIFIILPFGFAYQWGFLNFIVAAPFGFIFLSEISDFKNKDKRDGWVRVALWVHFLFFAHFLIAAFFCAAAIFILAEPWSGIKKWFYKILPIFSVLPITVAWLVIGFNSAPEARGNVMWMVGLNRVIEFLPSLVSAPTPGIGQLIGLTCLILPFIWGAQPKRSVFSWAPFGLYIIWMMFVPHLLGGNYFTYQRFGLFGLPLYFLCFEISNKHPIPSHSALAGVGLALIASSIVGWHSVRALIFEGEASGYRAVMEKADPGKRILMFAFKPTSQASSAPLHLHFAGWYQAEHGGLAEFNFARFWGLPVKYKIDAPSGIFSGFEWYPANFDWTRNHGELFDYFLVRHPQDASEWIKEKSNGAMRPIARNGEWQLYEKK